MRVAVFAMAVAEQRAVAERLPRQLDQELAVLLPEERRAICPSTWPEHAPEPGGSSCATLGRVHAALRPGHTAEVNAYGDCRAIARQQ